MNRRMSQAVAARLTWIRLRVTHFMARSRPLLLGGGGQIVELDDRIGLGPDAELARVGERRVVGVDDLLPIEEDLEVISLGLDREVVPLSGSDLPIPARELAPVALDHVVEAHVVLQRVCPGLLTSSPSRAT